MPELAHIRITLDRCIDQLAVLLLDLADIDSEGEIAVIVELHWPARRIRQGHALDGSDQFVRFDVATGRLERRFQNLAVHIQRRGIEPDRGVGAVILVHRVDKAVVRVGVEIER